MKLALLAACLLASTAANASPECRSSADNASYTGAALGTEDVIPVEAFIQDVYCADTFRRTKYPHGFVTVFGGSRLQEDTSHSYEQKTDDGKLYDDVMTFAGAWTKSHGKQYPIMTGAGGGLMEAASRGATASGGPSIGYTTYYGSNTDPKLAFWRYPANTGAPIISDGLIFSSVAVRENSMMNASRVIIIAPGGTGTEWEIFQILEMSKSSELMKRPIFLIGSKARYWKSFYDRIGDLKARGMLGNFDLESLFQQVEDVKQLMPLIERVLPN